MENNLSNKKITTIVYLTLNLKNGKIYIGVHDVGPEYPKFDGYIGNMVNVFYPKTIAHPKEPFQYAVKKYGFNAFKRITLRECTSREEALEWEQMLVDDLFLQRNDVYNIQYGGGAPPMYKHKVFLYDINGKLKQEFDSILDASKKLNYSNSRINYALLYRKETKHGYFTDYYVEQLDTTPFNTTKSRIVYIYDKNGKFVEEVKCLKDAAKKFNVCQQDITWAIRGQYKIQDHYISLVKYDTFTKKIYQRHIDTPVHQYALSGEYIKTFNSISEATRENPKFKNIARSISIQKTCGGYQWSWDKVDRMPNNEFQPHSGRPIAQYTLDGELVKKYRTIREAKNSGFGNVQHVLDGRATQTKGYTFRYLDEDKLKI